MKTHKWNDMKHRGMTPERIAAADRRVEEEIVAIRLRDLREAEGVTQEELARRVEVAQTQVSRAEHRGNLLSVYRGVNRTTPVNALEVNVFDTGTEDRTHVETPTPALTTTVPDCLLLAGLSPDTAVDAPVVVSSWPPGFGNDVSVMNPQHPLPYAWTNLFLAERPWPTPATLPASSIGWDIVVSQTYCGALSFVLALAPAL